jgi:molecular chaperone GrpE
MNGKNDREMSKNGIQDEELNTVNGETESPLAREDAAEVQEDASAPSGVSDETETGDDTAEELKKALEKKEKEYQELLDRTQRLAAEYDNFRKRTQKEKERLYSESTCDIVAKFLPVVDNLERALKAAENEETDAKSLREGVVLVCRQISDILDKLDVKPIEAVGKTFNHDIHNAVMHIEDENYGEGEIVEEFQKGYIYKNETVIRYSMVKVAN